MTTNEIEEIVKQICGLIDVAVGPIDDPQNDVEDIVRQSLLAYGEKCREEAKKEEREKTEGEIYNELVKIADKSYGVLRMLDVAKYILVERTKESNSLTEGYEGKGQS